MKIFFTIVVGIALLTVLLTLVLGMLNMRQGGEKARLRANKLMWARVWAQATAVFCLILLVYINKTN